MYLYGENYEDMTVPEWSKFSRNSVKTVRTWVAALLVIACLSADIHAQSRDVLIAFESDIVWQKVQVPMAKEEKGLFVYDALQRQAAQSQQRVRNLLQDRDIPFSSFSVVNAIQAEIPSELASVILDFPEVTAISENSPFTEERITTDDVQISPRSAAPEWGILHIRADSVWSLGFTGQGVVIGGQDTGYEWDHPALRSKYRGADGDAVSHDYNWHDAIHEISPLNGDSIIMPENNPCGLDVPIPCDDRGHGTHTMGTMVGSDSVNQIGVAPDAQWIGCRNMERGWGKPSTYLECMEWFLAPTDVNGDNPDPTKAPHVMNNSWSCPEIEGCNPGNFELLRQAVVNLRAAGIVVVVSAGNSGNSCSSVSAPLAMFEESFTVGAINMQDTIANFSSRGPVQVDSSFRLKPNISAPGVQVRSAWLDSTYRNANGTSMAGPHVAGVVALMISANPDLAGQVEVIETIIENTARPKESLQECGGTPGTVTPNNTFGHGVIDALAAVEAALMVSTVEEPVQGKVGPVIFFPNPASDYLNLRSTELQEIQSLRIFSTDGRLVQSTGALALPARVELHNLSPGLYVVQADHYVPGLIHVSR